MKRGTVVRGLAGHDRGRFMAVLGMENGRALVADGRTRSVEYPKKKNAIHLSATAAVLTEAQMESDSKLREALRGFGKKTV